MSVIVFEDHIAVPQRLLQFKTKFPSIRRRGPPSGFGQLPTVGDNGDGPPVAVRVVQRVANDCEGGGFSVHGG